MECYSLNGESNTEWKKVKEDLVNGADIESSLDFVENPVLLEILTNITGKFIASVDYDYAIKIARGEIEWPLTRILKKIVDNLPEGDRELNVVTPNYDMLLEYSCDYIDIPYTNGFIGGVTRKMNWFAADYMLHFPVKVMYGGRMRNIFKRKKHIKLYKVHGSLNYFFFKGNIIENNSWMWNPPTFANRVMIVPGSAKYEVLQCYRQELLSKADTAIERENHFLFIGYGFNDKHLEVYIRRKLVDQKCMGLIITRDFNPRIESLIYQAENLWLICKTQEPDNAGSRIFNMKYSNWVNHPINIWDIKVFTSEIIGG